MRISNELQTGKAGEYLTCCDLALKGFIAFPSEQGLPYDVLLDTGYKLLKVQVKTTTKPRMVPQRNVESHAYIFNIKRHGKGNSKRYGIGEVDLFALVSLDTMSVGYLVPKDMPETLNLRVDSLRGSYYDEKGIKDYERVIAARGTMSQQQIAKEVGIHFATVSRMCADGFAPHRSTARYFSDLNRNAEWFLSI